MKKLEVITCFTDYTQIELLEKAKYILASMKGNLHFPNPVPGIPTLERSINNFSTALYDEQEYVGVKTIARSILTDELNQLAKYVNAVAAGKEAELASSGFTVNSLLRRRTA